MASVAPSLEVKKPRLREREGIYWGLPQVWPPLPLQQKHAASRKRNTALTNGIGDTATNWTFTVWPASEQILGLQQGFHLSFCCWVMIFVLNTQQGWCMEASFLTSAAQCGISPLLPEVHTLCKENCTPQWYLKSWGSFQVLVPHIKEESPNILTCTNDWLEGLHPRSSSSS